MVGGPPGTALHTVVDGLPSGAVGEIFPVVVMPTGVGMVPNDAAGAIMDVEGGLGTVDGDGTCMAVMEGDGSAGMEGMM